MKKTNRKGFTLVELVIVIAVIAILAGVLIGTFASVIKRANDSAKVQQIKNDEIAQKADDIIEKIENSNWFGWEEFETEIVTAVAKAVKENSTPYAQLDSSEIKKVVEDAVKTALANIKVENTGLTAEDVKAIVENAMGSLKYEGVTEAQVRAIVNGATANLLGNELTAAQVRAIVNAANEKNLTAVQLANVLSSQLSDVATLDALNAKMGDLQSAITGATANLATKEDVQTILDTIENFETTVNSSDLDDVITAKALNIRIKNAGLTSANTPYDVVSTIEATDSELKNTILLSIEAGQLGFFVVNADRKVVNPCGLTITVNADDTVVYKYWTFASTVSSYLSTYLVSGAASPVIAEGVGVDVGTANVTAINYTSNTGREVVIRTNGGTLTINGSDDHVEHYGIATTVDVQSISNTTYVEHGTVGKLIVQENAKKVVIKAEAIIIELDKKTSESIVNVEGYVGMLASSSEQITTGELGGNTIRVYTADQLQGLALSSSLGTSNDFVNGKTILIENDIDLTGRTWTPFGYSASNPFHGVIDGQNHTIKGLTNGEYVNDEFYITTSNTAIKAYGFIALAKDNVTVRNLTLDVNINWNAGGVGGVIAMHDFSKFTANDGSSAVTYTCLIENVTVTGSIVAGDKSGGFMSGMYSKLGNASDFANAGSKYIQKVIFKNCVNKANISGEDRLGGFIGASNTGHGTSERLSNKIPSPGVDITAFIEFDNCKNEGNITDSAASGKAGGFISQASTESADGTEACIIFKNNCSNSGILTASKTANLIAYFNGAKKVSVNGEVQTIGTNQSLD